MRSRFVRLVVLAALAVTVAGAFAELRAERATGPDVPRDTMSAEG